MANLSELQKREIVAALACFCDSATIIANFRSEHGLELSHKQVGRYDPTRSYYDAGDKWRELFEARRKTYLENVADVPIAHQGYRLQMLQQGVDAAKKAKNWVLLAELLKQAAKEVGGTLTNGRKVRTDDRHTSPIDDMTPVERRAAMAELIRQALEAPPVRLAPIIEDCEQEAA